MSKGITLNLARIPLSHDGADHRHSVCQHRFPFTIFSNSESLFIALFISYLWPLCSLKVHPSAIPNNTSVMVGHRPLPITPAMNNGIPSRSVHNQWMSLGRLNHVV
uniref:Ovule protein n=1 Tax=Heterorhabditis bacteriophora TaxID=37862 RepID=A0A1I7WQC1_HETBA